MSENLTAISYLISGIFFILALKGLSHPESARNGNIMGIIGMIIAVLTTLFNPNVLSYKMIVIGLLIGGAVGTYIALKIEMTALPQLVAAFHSLVGLAAVFVATSAFYAPESYGIVSDNGSIFPASLVEMSIGVAIGAITFTGSIIAFLKLQGLVSGAPTTFFGQHFLNLLIFISLIVLTVMFTIESSTNTFWIIVRFIIIAWYFINNPNRRGRYAGSCINVKFIFRLGSGGNRFYFIKSLTYYCRIPCWCFWCNT